MTREFYNVSFMKKRTIIYWNIIKLNQHNSCSNINIFTSREIFAFVNLDLERTLENISQSLENHCIKSYFFLQLPTSKCDS